MHDLLNFTPADRILVLAPHPDDESIATGGLIQSALTAGAAIHAVVLTDGDANVWPQRWIEKRWRIDAAARARWGARRRDEARAAMRVLGLEPTQATFLGLPDMGLTGLLMCAGEKVLSGLRERIAAFAPSIVVLPSAADRHPDHNATHVLARLALDGVDGPYPRLLEFAVHGGANEGSRACVLSAEQQARKRAAILAHATQMRLSSRRFLRHAGPVENYVEAGRDADCDATNPLRAHLNAAGELRVEIPASQTTRGRVLLAVLAGAWGVRCMSVEWKPGAVSMTLPLENADWRLGFVKLARPQPGLLIFDSHGWQAIDRN